MTLVKTGGGVTDIRGPEGGVYFTRDKSGLHCSSKPRRVHQITDAQRKQRNAFIKARAACLATAPTVIPKNQLNRWVSYYIYLALNNIPFTFDITATGTPVPDCTGIYIKVGEIFGQNYYSRTDGAYFIWCKVPPDLWVLSVLLGIYGEAFWATLTGFTSYYYPYNEATGSVRISLELQPPPPDYQIPKL
ncbi:hypothetical protein ES703_18851 [subsurface metagenome]